MARRFRRGTPSRARDGERGAVLALVALGAVGLLGAAGLAIDGGRMLEERRHAQAAADHAATTAAHAQCVGKTEAQAITAGKAIAKTNGFDDAASTVVVAITAVTGSPNTFRAVITSTIEATFSRVLGFGTFDVSAEATGSGTGCGSGGTGPGTLYGGGSCPSGKYGIDIPGSSQKVFGKVHTNDTSKVGGSSNDFDDETVAGDQWTYGEAHSNTGGGNTWETPWPQQDTSTTGWPAGWAPGDFTGAVTGAPAAGTFLRPYYDLAVANGTFFTTKVDSITKDGVYYTTHTDGFDVGSVTGTPRNVVLVATQGPIKVSGGIDNKTFNPYQHPALPKPGLLIVSGKEFSGASGNVEKCDKFAIAISGSNTAWNGILWARGGLIEFSGSNNTAVVGSAIGWGLRLNGSNLTIRFDPALFPGTPQILIVK